MKIYLITKLSKYESGRQYIDMFSTYDKARSFIGHKNNLNDEYSKVELRQWADDFWEVWVNEIGDVGGVWTGWYNSGESYIIEEVEV